MFPACHHVMRATHNTLFCPETSEAVRWLDFFISSSDSSKTPYHLQTPPVVRLNSFSWRESQHSTWFEHFSSSPSFQVSLSVLKINRSVSVNLVKRCWSSCPESHCNETFCQIQKSSMASHGCYCCFLLHLHLQKLRVLDPATQTQSNDHANLYMWALPRENPNPSYSKLSNA